MTDEKLLELALRGGETEWEELHRLCLDRATAERLGKALERSGKEAFDIAAAWAGVVEELHPGLKVNFDTAEPPPPAKATAQDKRALRILCAEDHEQICELLKKVLSDAGHHVECVFDGQAAWERLSADPLAFDVLITDYQMPCLSGLELVQKVRDTAFDGWIVVESGNLTPEIEAAFNALKVDRIVRKTFRPEFITELIAELA